MPQSDYVELLQEEIRQKSAAYQKCTLDTLYFGGGTPSLLEPRELNRIIEGLAQAGFPIASTTEVTLEINPATLTSQKVRDYQSIGFNRFSVGCQTFDDVLLKKLGREHDSKDTIKTIELLQAANLNFSLDLLFALPDQSLEMLEKDVEQMLSFHPPHISPYCLTIPEGHVLNPGRPIEDIQVQMFELIHKRFSEQKYLRYEISNYSQPNKESRHNNLYWTDAEYWGIGLSAHSYSHQGNWGIRFWNPPSAKAYGNMISSHRGQKFSSPDGGLDSANFEWLQKNQALTDFFHTSLRRAEGVDLSKVQHKFQDFGVDLYQPAIDQLVRRGLLKTHAENQYFLSEEGIVLSNEVFRELTFLAP